eukprot:8756052-Pyramimonas_sp.AAC.1
MLNRLSSPAAGRASARAAQELQCMFRAPPVFTSFGFAIDSPLAGAGLDLPRPRALRPPCWLNQ